MGVQKVVYFEIIGILFISILGSLLHFVYAWSGNTWWVGIFAAVNESVWEHLKLAFWPAVAWSLIGWRLVSSSVRNFWVGRSIALTLMPIAIGLGFYGYTAVLGHHALVFDLALFVLAIALGQLAALLVYYARPIGAFGKIVALSIIVVECLAFGSLTFFPPDIAVFSDPSA